MSRESWVRSATTGAGHQPFLGNCVAEGAWTDETPAHAGRKAATVSGWTIRLLDSPVHMNRPRAVAGGATVISLVSIGLAASAFPDTHPLTPQATMSGDGGTDVANVWMNVQCPDPLTSLWGILVFLGILTVAAVLFRRHGYSVYVPLVGAAPPYVAWILLCEPFALASLEVGARQLGRPLNLELILLSFSLVAVIVHAIAIGWVWRLLSGSPVRDVEPRSEPPEATLEELGSVAGDIADRLEQPDSEENLVFTAWAELTGFVDVESPRSATPIEFAEAAIDAGMDPAHVEELTDLFQKVRYGGEESEPFEDRAVTVLRRIETAYHPEGGDE